jgi:hypothetical protein
VAFLLHGISNTGDRGFWESRQSHPYPGHNFCNANSPHALYHEGAADGLVELYAVVDEVKQILQKQRQNQGCLEAATVGMQVSKPARERHLVFDAGTAIEALVLW